MSDITQQWNDNKDRPAWVQANRDELMELTGLDDIPRSRSEIDEYLGSKKGVITRRLNDEGDEEDE